MDVHDVPFPTNCSVQKRISSTLLSFTFTWQADDRFFPLMNMSTGRLLFGAVNVTASVCVGVHCCPKQMASATRAGHGMAVVVGTVVIIVVVVVVGKVVVVTVVATVVGVGVVVGLAVVVVVVLGVVVVVLGVVVLVVDVVVGDAVVVVCVVVDVVIGPVVVGSALTWRCVP